VTTHLGPEPSYCTSLLGKPRTPSQWATCWKYGWNEPTVAAARIGHDYGHNVLPVLIVVGLLVALAVFIARPGRT
jgi:hypothetical protein